MAVYTVRLEGSREIASGTMAFHLEKPAEFAYKAGQFADLTLIDPPEAEARGRTQAFSLASAPFEDGLMVATRMRDTAFKRVLGTMAPGTALTLDAPHGSFTLHGDARVPAVFIAGGIGITPVRSIVLQAASDRVPHRIVVFYSNRRPEDAAFLDELMEARASFPNLTLVATITKLEHSGRDWSGETGYITRPMLARSIGDLDVPIFYISGPKAMVSAMRKLLADSGVGKDRIRTEQFSGY